MFWKKTPSPIHIILDVNFHFPYPKTEPKKEKEKEKEKPRRNKFINVRVWKNLKVGEQIHIRKEDWPNKSHPSSTIYGLKSYLGGDATARKTATGWVITKTKE